MPARARVLAAGAVVLAVVVWVVFAWMGPKPAADPSSRWGPLAVLDSDSVP